MGPFIHRQMTSQWAIELGFPADVAEVIAIANVMVDGDAKAYPRRFYHMRPILFGRDMRVETADLHLQHALAAAQRGECDACWHHLGKGLHVMQDLVAHGSARVHRHWMDSTEFTGGRRDPQQTRLAEAERVSKGYLMRALADSAVLRCLHAPLPG